MASLRLICALLIIVVICLKRCDAISQVDVNAPFDPTNLLRDNYGCDAVISSCGKKGKCCDVHDACYKKYKCTAISWFYLCEFHRLSTRDLVCFNRILRLFRRDFFTLL
jgi:hypothetical protein